MHVKAKSAIRFIPSLDGLRAVSVLIVLLAHSGWYLPSWLAQNIIFVNVVGNGSHGVAVFFVISGYLITTLLLREVDKNGKLDVTSFYIRRSWRIFPPFYAYLSAMAALWAANVIPENGKSFAAAATYTWSLYPRAHGYFLTHTWSLSIEELFYLGWPALLTVSLRMRSCYLTGALIVIAMPLIRLSLYDLFPILRGHEGYMLQGWLDTIVVGCLIAIWKRDSSQTYLIKKVMSGWLAGLALVSAFFLLPFVEHLLPKRWSGLFSLAVAPGVSAICIGYVMLFLIERPNGIAGRALNLSLVRHIGTISYSVYLWQQLFLSRELHLLPLGYLGLFAVAECSYWGIERPSLQLRNRNKNDFSSGEDRDKKG